MECSAALAAFERLLDRELSWLGRLGLSRHLKSCPSCGHRLEEARAMRTALRQSLTYHHAPPGLAARIVGSLPREAPVPESRSWLARIPALPFAGTGLAGALAGAALTVLVWGGGNGESLTAAVVDSHINSLMANHLTDVLTSDQHTVKPWLSSHIDVSPPVRDLAAEGFTLIGGRLSYIDGHPAAAVVYRRAKHVINLFAWAAPGKPDETFRTASLQGYNVVTWRANGIAYFAVSDVEAPQLMAFARLEASP